MANLSKILNHIDTDYVKPLRDPLWNNIMLSEGIKKILSSSVMQKLNKIKQLGPTYLVYPGATHTRLSHSIGVFHISKRILRELVISPQCPDITLEGAVSFLCAALLHDLGHFPYAHSLKELPLIDHEVLTGKIILSQPLYNEIKESLKIDPAFVAAIVDKNIKENITNEVMFFRNLLSGVLDPDKLDYLNRDAYFCGVPYGMQDIDFIISSILPHKEKGIAVYEHGLPAIENILFSKYLMYRAVYWHKTIRSATAMAKKALFMGLKDKKINPEELYDLDDETLFSNYRESSYKPFSLLKNISERKLYKMVLEIPFCNEDKNHNILTSLDKRHEKEDEILLFIRKKYFPNCGEESVIIDIPEKISFEVNLPVFYKNNFDNFTESGSVFNGTVIKGFTETLRKIRVFMPENICEKFTKNISAPEIAEILMNTQTLPDQTTLPEQTSSGE
ncbi:MAG: HD domain-containing protein [Spirochaetaceae bacterium]|nr:HD domain-containing protein [Spirochaetaceae bacterium]